MKICNVVILTLFLFLVARNQIFAQEKKQEFIISGILAHYSNVGKMSIGDLSGFYTYRVNPGVEAIYMYSVSPNLKLGAGINFQTGENMSWKRDLLRFRYSEISIPLLVRVRIFRFLNKTMNCYSSMGLYTGKLFNVKAEDTDSFGNWKERTRFDSDFFENYSYDNFFTDLQFDLGVSHSVGRIGEISIAPFTKYRQNTTWLEFHKERVHYGIKINYHFKI